VVLRNKAASKQGQDTFTLRPVTAHAFAQALLQRHVGHSTVYPEGAAINSQLARGVNPWQSTANKNHRMGGRSATGSCGYRCAWCLAFGGALGRPFRAFACVEGPFCRS